jgi:hypothetical protein
MPIGLVSDSLFSDELSRLNRGSEKESPKVESPQIESHNPEVVIEDIPKRGRSEGDKNVPDSLRQIIAEEALLNGRESALSLAKDFNISSSSVSAYTKGATSTTTYNAPSKSIISHINKSRERAVKRASKTLNAALGAITQEKLDYADASDLSGIAKDMSVIIKNLEPQKEVETDGKQVPQFVIYAPQFKDERVFESIVVNE